MESRDFRSLVSRFIELVSAYFDRMRSAEAVRQSAVFPLVVSGPFRIFAPLSERMAVVGRFARRAGSTRKAAVRMGYLLAREIETRGGDSGQLVDFIDAIEGKDRDALSRWIPLRVALKRVAIQLNGKLPPPHAAKHPGMNGGVLTPAGGDEPLARRAVAGRGQPRSSRKGASVNARMLDTLDKIPASKDWSVRKWLQHLGCRSTSTVHKTTAWRTIVELRHAEKVGRILNDKRRTP